MTVKLLANPLYLGFVDGFETSGAVIPSDPGAPFGHNLISSPRFAADAIATNDKEMQTSFLIMLARPVYHGTGTILAEEPPPRIITRCEVHRSATGAYRGARGHNLPRVP